MANINNNDLVTLVGTSNSKSGFEDAHIVGKVFSGNFKDNWFAKLFGAEGADAVANITELPQTTQGGATLGVGSHRGLHVQAFDKLLYDFDQETNPFSKKFLNVLEQQLAAKLEARSLKLKDINLAVSILKCNKF